MAETTQAVTAQGTEQTAKAQEPSKVEVRRAKEKELRATVKPDYRSQGVTIKVLKANPKKTGSKAHAVFALYADGKTVEDVLKAAEDLTVGNEKVGRSYAGACFMWDTRHGFIELIAPAKPEPKPAETKPAEQKTA